MLRMLLNFFGQLVTEQFEIMLSLRISRLSQDTDDIGLARPL